jgi:hypothetical protein
MSCRCHGSGRVYITLGESITTSVIGSTRPFTVSDPNLGSSSDPNFYKIYDKFESTYLPYTTGDANERNPLFINITSVDSLSLPLALELTGVPAGGKPGPVGYLKSRSDIFSGLEAGLKDGVTMEWEKLIQELDGVPLRAIAPNKGLKAIGADGNDPCTQAGSDPCFDRDYFKDYLEGVWNHYNHAVPANVANTITINANEILSPADLDAGKTLKYKGSVTAGDCTKEPEPTPSCGRYLDDRSHQITSINGAFCFIRDPLDGTTYNPAQPDSIPVALPSTDDMISGAGALCPPNKSARSIIARDFNALLNRGLLPIAGSTYIDDGDKTATGFWKTQADNFYTNWPQGQKPNYNVYAEILHDFLSTGGVYAFAFDDVGGEDSTLVDESADSAIVTIQDLSGTTIPNPTAADTRRYSGNISLPGEGAFPLQTVEYDGKVLNAGANEAFDNVTSPINLVWVVDGVKHPLALHLGTRFISPAPLGNRSYGIVLTAPTGETPRWTISFPGGTAPSPWPSGSAPSLALQTASSRSIVLLTKGVIGKDYANLPADWYLWVRTAANTLYYCDVCDKTTSHWVLASDEDAIKPFRKGVRLPVAEAPVTDASISADLLATGSNVFHFSVNTTRYFPRKDDGTRFDVSDTYQK